MVTLPTPSPSPTLPQLYPEFSSEFPHELFWRALHIFRQILRYAGDSGIFFTEALPWITAMHTRFFHPLAFSDNLPIYLTLFTDRTYTQTNRICPIHQIFTSLGIIPSQYLILKHTLIESGYWVARKISPIQINQKSLYIKVKAQRLIIHSHQYKTLATLREIKSQIYTLTRSSSEKLRFGLKSRN